MKNAIDNIVAFSKKTWPYVRAFLVGVGLMTVLEIVAGLISSRESTEVETEVYLEEGDDETPDRIVIEETHTETVDV